MKRLIITLVAILTITSISYAQESPTLRDEYIYCEIVGEPKALSFKKKVTIDFGELNALGLDQRLFDENGKPLVFNSMVGALNYMARDGWEFVHAYDEPYGESFSISHWILKLNLNTISEKDKKIYDELIEAQKTTK